MSLEEETFKCLNAAWLASKNFFSHANVVQKVEDTMITKYGRINHLSLLGFNRPSPHKLLFRVSFLNGRPESLQPWPDELDNGQLKELSLKLSSCLHALLSALLEQIQMQLDEQFKNEAVNEACHKKRKKENSTNQKKHAIDLSHCPLDYFYYHTPNKQVENCSEHVDRGLLICICLTNVAGLEVLSRQDGVWYCPEKLSICEKLYRDYPTGCSNLICILSGDQLKTIFSLDDNDIEERYPGLNACVHRVKKELSACRLSISYELRNKY
jgi:hypothetical protein